MRQPLVHHSDRGIQYCFAHYQRLHAEQGTTYSMTDDYDCYQNALAEQVNGILKNDSSTFGSAPGSSDDARGRGHL
jgi:transposase InsO family protein